MNLLFYGLEVQQRSRWGKNQCVHRDMLLSGSSRGEPDSLPFIAARSCPRSLAVCPAASSRPEAAAQLLLVFVRSDFLFCLSPPLLGPRDHLGASRMLRCVLRSLAWFVRPLRLLAHQESVGYRTAAYRAPLSMGLSRQEYWLEWVAISCPKGSSPPRDRTCVSCIGRWILYYNASWESHLFRIIYLF